MFYHLRQLRIVRKSLTKDSAKTLAHALIAGRLDYCNAVLYLINTNAVKTLYSLSFTQLLDSSCRSGSLTLSRQHLETIYILHWLTVSQRITYKLRTIVYKCLHQSAPEYFRELRVPVTNTASRRHLRSAVRGDLQVLATRT